LVAFVHIHLCSNINSKYLLTADNIDHKFGCLRTCYVDHKFGCLRTYYVDHNYVWLLSVAVSPFITCVNFTFD